MQKENKKQTNRKKSIIILITVMALIGIIIGSIVIRNVVVNQKTEGESYLAGENAGSSLMASYIRKGVTIGGITGTLESLDTSDATAKPEDILEGKTAYVNGVKITGTMKEKVNMGDITGEEKENTETQDSLGNKVVVPAGFKVVNPHDNVEKGIIIEDVSAGDNNTKGSQFVWIPVGKIKTSQGEKTITLGRYDFASDGTPSAYSGPYKEETPSEHASSGYKNAIAKDIDAFKNSANANGGYYIGRYEAGDALATSSERTESTSDTNPIVCKTGVYPYTWITQPQASSLCQNMYSSSNFTSDLINSYAWDTAILFIQECSGDKNYSRQIGKNTKNSLQKVGESILANVDSEDESRDVRCNIYDMAGNTYEWTTETHSYTGTPCVGRGGSCTNSNYCTSNRVNNYGTSSSIHYLACRTTLYL